MSTPWDARTYDMSSTPQQAWAQDVLSRLDGIPPDARILDVGCGTGRVTKSPVALVPAGRVLAIDASLDMVKLARARVAEDRADVWCEDALALEIAEPVDVIVSTAALHWVTDHGRLWQRLAAALRPAGILESNAEEQGDRLACAKSSKPSPETPRRNLSASHRGSSPVPKTPSDACITQGSARSIAGCKSGRRTRRT